MLKEIINMDNLSLENCNDARTLFLYLYYNNGNNLNELIDMIYIIDKNNIKIEFKNICYNKK